MRHDYYSRGYFFQRLDGAIFFNNQLPTRERCHARPGVIYYTFDENELMHAGFRASSRRPRVIYFVRWRGMETRQTRARDRNDGSGTQWARSADEFSIHRREMIRSWNPRAIDNFARTTKNKEYNTLVSFTLDFVTIRLFPLAINRIFLYIRLESGCSFHYSETSGIERSLRRRSSSSSSTVLVRRGTNLKLSIKKKYSLSVSGKSVKVHLSSSATPSSCISTRFFSFSFH